MRIGIDVSTILNFGVNVGSGRYIINLIKGLLSLNEKINKQKNNEKKLFNLQKDILNEADEVENKKKYDEKDNNEKASEKIFKDKLFKNNSFILTGWYTSDENLQYIIELKEKYPTAKIKLNFFKLTQEKFDNWNRRSFPPIEFKGFKADVLHCPDYLILPTLNKNIILTIHDLSFYRFPEFNFEWFIKKYQSVVLKNAQRAKKIIADSQSTKQDIVNFMKISPQKINVVYLAADEKFKAMAPETLKLKKDTLKKFKIPKKYIFSVGTIEPRKNFKTLIKAFNVFKKSFTESGNYCLVIAGKTGWKSEETFEEYKKSSFKEEIIFTGEVSDEELVTLYNQASLFVYPSIFEGFGLPVLEAMSCGLPVITTDTSSIPEIYPQSEFLLDPFDEVEMAKKINLVLTNENLKNNLIKFSLEMANKFSWEQTALKTMKIYYSFIK
ncbi:MAG: glycosyltransferase family 4 protein [Actinobacteria bacterium]|nr:glycosyltransferase family 4 protein [Actinomycetota bacterium]